MSEPILKDPRELHHTGKSADQDQDNPALQDKMLPEPAYAREGADVAIQLFPSEERDAEEIAE